MALKRSRKLEVVYAMYLKKITKDGNSEALLKIFLDKKREILFEISTRLYEEERKKAEDETRDVSMYFLTYG